MLGAWADYIVVLQSKFADKFVRFKEKVRVLDVGEDIWKNPLHPELQRIVSNQAKKWAGAGWRF